MGENCATSCEEEAHQAIKDMKELDGIDSFFQLSALDIAHQEVHFSQFSGDVTIVVNVASYCGYTDSHYKGLVQLWNVVKDSGKVHILAFPCNQFGEQEPDENEAIDAFAAGYGVEFTMMNKVDVNGPNASPVYKFLKAKAGPAMIRWNFNTYFVVGPDGAVHSLSDVEPMNLAHLALGLAQSGEEL
jgi:glutathione peroxidase